MNLKDACHPVKKWQGNIPTPKYCGGSQMRSRILAGFLAVAMSVISFAPALAAGGTNGNLNGTVVDASSKAPIAGASVIARSGSGSYAATTDARGFFSILHM